MSTAKFRHQITTFRESLDKRMEIKRLHKLIQYERYN